MFWTPGCVISAEYCFTLHGVSHAQKVRNIQWDDTLRVVSKLKFLALRQSPVDVFLQLQSDSPVICYGIHTLYAMHGTVLFLNLWLAMWLTCSHSLCIFQSWMCLCNCYPSSIRYSSSWFSDPEWYGIKWFVCPAHRLWGMF